MWENEYGEVFETEEDARDSVGEYMDIDDYCEYMGYHMTFDELFHKVVGLNGFWDALEDELSTAESVYFNDHYHKTDDD